jgi:hypothetical protein
VSWWWIGGLLGLGGAVALVLLVALWIILMSRVDLRE